MNNEGFISSYHVFALLIHDLIKPRKFNCVTAVSRGISSALPRNLPNSPRNLSNFAAENCGPYLYVNGFTRFFINFHLFLNAPVHVVIVSANTLEAACLHAWLTSASSLDSCPMGPSIMYVTLFWTSFYPLPLSHFVTHLSTPLKYITHLGPPDF